MVITFIQFFSNFKEDFVRAFMPDAIATGEEVEDCVEEMFREFGFYDCLQYIKAYPGEYEKDSVAFNVMRENIPQPGTLFTTESNLLTVVFDFLDKEFTLNIRCAWEGTNNMGWQSWKYKDLANDHAVKSYDFDDGLFYVPLIEDVKKCDGLDTMPTTYMWFCSDWSG